MTVAIEERLADLAAALEVPPPPAPAALLAALPDRRRRGRPAGGRRPTRRAFALATAIALLAAATALAVPSSRRTILRVLGLEGVRVERTPVLPPIRPGVTATLGRRIPLARVRHAAAFSALETPRAGAAYLAQDLPGGRITLVAGHDLIFEFRATVGPILQKLVGLATRTQFVRVNGGPGVYFSGAPHELGYLAPDGSFRTDRVRLAGNVLLWQQGPLTLRIEGSHTLAAALALARSLR